MMWDWWVETAKIDHVSRAFADANGKSCLKGETKGKNI